MAEPRETPEQFYQRFGGGLIYTVDKKTLKYLLEKTSGTIFWKGQLEKIVFKHLGLGVYNVCTESIKDLL